MRNRAPRSFTVETKSGGRHQRTFIPHRAAAPASLRPAVSWPPPSEPQEPAAETRRILPNLIAAEPLQLAPEPTQVSEERLPKLRRGRPPKVKQVPAEMAEEPIAEPAAELAVAAPVPALDTFEVRPVRPAKSTPALPLGERWKRRLSRWAR